ANSLSGKPALISANAAKRARPAFVFSRPPGCKRHCPLAQYVKYIKMPEKKLFKKLFEERRATGARPRCG
ncbi:MAG: hypothetical protein ACOX8N_04470, partial [Christensenellales bacterium]